MKYRIKEYIYGGNPVYKAQKIVLGFIWEDMPDTISWSYESCEQKLCKIIKNKKEYPKYHEVDCDE